MLSVSRGQKNFFHVAYQKKIGNRLIINNFPSVADTLAVTMFINPAEEDKAKTLIYGPGI